MAVPKMRSAECGVRSLKEDRSKDKKKKKREIKEFKGVLKVIK